MICIGTDVFQIGLIAIYLSISTSPHLFQPRVVRTLNLWGANGVFNEEQLAPFKQQCRDMGIGECGRDFIRRSLYFFFLALPFPSFFVSSYLTISLVDLFPTTAIFKMALRSSFFFSFYS